MKNELKVGIFIFVAMLFLFFLTTQINSFKNLSKKGYTIYTDLKNAAGLNVNSKVKANGIDVGYIKNLSIQKDHIKAEIFINDGVKIPKDSVLTAMQESMLGGKYAAITLGKSDSYLQNNSIIKSSKELASINEASDSMTKAADEIRVFVKDLRDVLNDKTKQNLKNSFANINQITSDLREFTKLGRLNEAVDSFNNMANSLAKTSQKFSLTADEINHKLPDIMKNIDTLISDLKFTSQSIRTKLPALADKYSAIADELDSLVKDSKKPLQDSLKSADGFFATGKSAFDKVDSLLESVDKIQLEVAMHAEMMSDDEYAKGYLSLDYQPSDTKSYRFDIVGMDDYSRLSDDGGYIKPKKHEETNLLYSAQITKRFDDLTLRTGIIESTFGAGVDYYMFNRQLKASAELFDMNAQNDVRGDKAHAKVSAKYTFLKHLDIYAGYDNFLNDNAKNAFVGVGVRFYDDDLKTLVLSQGVSGLAK